MIESKWINKPRAKRLALQLQERGYAVTAKDCNEYALNVIRHTAGMNPDHAREVRAVIERLFVQQ